MTLNLFQSTCRPIHEVSIVTYEKVEKLIAGEIMTITLLVLNEQYRNELNA